MYSLYLLLGTFALSIITLLLIFGKPDEDHWLGFGVVSFISTAVIFVSVMMLFVPMHKVTYTTKIVSLQDNSEVEGSFTLGSGYIGESSYFCYYYNHIDGGYALGKEPTRNARIVEWDKKYAIKQYTREENKEWNTSGSTSGVVFYVPRGTIVRNYNLDAR